MTYENVPNIEQVVYAVTFIHKNSPDVIQWKMSNTHIDGIGYLKYIMMFPSIEDAGAVASQMRKQFSCEGSIWRGTLKNVYDHLEVKIVKINIQNMEVM